MLRAHPLLSGGVILGPVFRRRTTYLNVGTERWLERPSFVRLGVAAFLDVAHASGGFTRAAREPIYAYVGTGLRLRLPGSEGTLRVDYGRGLRDRGAAFTIGVVTQLP